MIFSMFEKLFDVCILDWNSVASQTLSQVMIPMYTRPLILSEKSLIIFGTGNISMVPSYFRHELFAVSFLSDSDHPKTLQWNGYVTTCAIDDVTSIPSTDKIVAALQDSSLQFFQVQNDQLISIDPIITWSNGEPFQQSQATIREMAYSHRDHTLWCAREDGCLGQYHLLSGQWMMKWAPIRDSFSSIQVVESVPHMITTSTDRGILYAWDTRQRREAFHWNANKQECLHIMSKEMI
ncbi:hypothetical protein GpartN1_g4345.t1 [Galdieria partita]|uniref:Uncharacterized protein n=1 Tax=Galdieria partita TaxID=83374 RepID=A0A9C7PXT9_9RHOD|nr:hypothetical protein GpartN1_g4345.t1 [Galdieria partita]